MAFEDDMIEAGFSNEEEYLESMCVEADKRLSYLRGLNNKESLLDKDTFGNKRILYWKLTNGVFVEGAFWTIKRDFRGHLKVGNVIRGPKIAYLEPGVFYELPDVYTQSEHFENGLARCYRNGIWGLINTHFEEVFFSPTCNVDKSLYISGKRLFVYSSTSTIKGREKTYKGLLDNTGSVLIPPLFGNIIDGGEGQISFFPGDFMFGSKNYKSFPIDKVFEFIHTSSGVLDWTKEPWPEQLVPYCENVRAILRNGLVGVEDIHHSMIIDCVFESILEPELYYDHQVSSQQRELRSRFLMRAYNDGYYYCFDLKGSLVRKFPDKSFLYAESKSYLDRKQYLYASLENSETGWYLITYAMVNTDGSILVQDAYKRYVYIPPHYDWAVCVYDENDEPNYVEVLKNGKYGLIDENLNVLVPCEYDLVDGMFFSGFNSDGLMTVKRDGKYGIMNNKWKEVVPCIHEKELL